MFGPSAVQSCLNKSWWASWGQVPATGFQHGQKCQLGAACPELVLGMAKNGNLGRMALNWFWGRGQQGPTMVCENKRAGAGADAAQTRWIVRWGGAKSNTGRRSASKGGTRVPRSSSHSCTQRHGHAPRPSTLWHHTDCNRPKGRRPSELLTRAYSLGLQGTTGATWFWTWPRMTTCAAWPSGGFGHGQQ